MTETVLQNLGRGGQLYLGKRADKIEHEGMRYLKMPFIRAFLISARRFDTKDKRKSPYSFMFPKEKPHYF